MGGERLARDRHDPRRVPRKSRFFAPHAIAGRARRYGLQTDASHRFERGVDPALQVRAIERATALLLDRGRRCRAGGAAATRRAPAGATGHPRCGASASGARARHAGADDAQRGASSAGWACRSSATPDGWQRDAAEPRFDSRIEADLIEEVARVHGYRPDPGPHRRRGVLHAAAVTESRVRLTRRVRRRWSTAATRGITFGFVQPALQRCSILADGAVALANPLSAAISRSCALRCGPACCAPARRTCARQQERMRCSSSAWCSRPGLDGPQETSTHRRSVAVGARRRAVGRAARAVDFFDLKGDVEALLGAGRAAEPRFGPARPAGAASRAVRAVLRARRSGRGLAGCAAPGCWRAAGSRARRRASVRTRSEPLVAGRAACVRRDFDVPGGPPRPRPGGRRAGAVRRECATAVLRPRRRSLRDLVLFDVYTGPADRSRPKKCRFRLDFAG